MIIDNSETGQRTSMTYRRNFSLKKNRSLRTILAWLELLDFQNQGLTWTYFTKPQQVISDIFERYGLRECMGIYPPFSQNRYNCETFLKSVAFYTMKANMDPAIDKEIRVMDDKSDGPPGMRQKVDALVESRDRGRVQNAVISKARTLLAMINFLHRKHSLGVDLREALATLAPLQRVALRTGDAVVAGEMSIEDGLGHIDHAIHAVEVAYEKANVFFKAEPSSEEFEGTIIAFGPVDWPSDLDNDSLDTIVAQVDVEAPSLMFHTNPLVAAIGDVPYFAGMLDMLLTEARRIKEVNFPLDEGVNVCPKHWDIDRRILVDDIEST